MAKHPTLEDDLEYTGEWSVPGVEETTTGTVSYRGGRLALNLFSRLSTFDLKPIEILLGGVVDGGICTAQNLRPISWKTTAPGADSDEFLVDYLFIGDHFATPDDIRFTCVDASYVGLEEWVGTPPFRIERGEAIKAIHVPPPPLKMSVPSHDLEVSLNYEFRSGGDRYRSLKWEHRMFLRLRPREEKKWDWFEEVIKRVGDLLTLLIGVPALPRAVVAHRPMETTLVKDELLADIHVYFNQPRFRPQAISAEVEPLVPLSKIADPESVFSAWLSKLDNVDQAARLLAGTMYNAFLYDELQLLVLLQGLETFHRRARGGKYLDDAAYRPIREALVKAIPQSLVSSFRDALKSRLKYGNEYSLRKRLTSLLAELSSSTNEMLFDNGNEVVGKIVDTRNFYTHYDEALRASALTGRDLFLANLRLRFLLTLVLLKEAEVAEDVLRERIRASRLFRAWLTSTQEGA